MINCKWMLLGMLGVPLVLAGCGAGSMHNSREVRSISTDQYRISVQRSGQVVVENIAGKVLMEGCRPEICTAAGKEPRQLATHALYSTRTPVHDALGDGQGVIFAEGDTEWYVRGYPAKPFITVQVVYVNKGRKPVTVTELSPLATGGRRGGGWRAGGNAASSFILEDGRPLADFDDLPAVRKGGGARSNGNIAAFNPNSRQSLIAGFLTHQRAATTLRLDRAPDAQADLFDTFRASCVYDPPVTVPPGGRLESEVFYLALNEGDPLEGLERYARAVAVWNGAVTQHPFLPHGWDSASAFRGDIAEAKLLAELEVEDAQLKRFGWNHFAIGGGWQKALGDWEADPAKFPRGMKAMADEAHRRGMTAGLWFAPFTVAPESELARAHPDWMLKPSAHAAGVVEGDVRILDVTRADVYNHVRGVVQRIAHEWGYDALEAGLCNHLLVAEGYAEPGMTRVEVLRRGLQAVRDGLGDDKFLGVSAPRLIGGVVADGVAAGRETTPAWRAEPAYGAVEAMTAAIRRFHFSSQLFAPDTGPVYFRHPATRARWNMQDKAPLTWNQSLAWLTGAALCGGPVKIGEPFSSLGAREINALRMVTPALPRAARPLDLFQEAAPRVWHTRLDGPAGAWHLLALFNWSDDTPAVIPVPLAALGIGAGEYVTVFDVWEGQYRGTATHELPVQVPQASVRLLGLRPYTGEPMLLASNRHIGMGALDHTEVRWDAQTRTLSGAFEAVADFDYALQCLLPVGHNAQGATCSAGAVTFAQDKRVVRLQFHSVAAGPCRWSVRM